MKKKLFGAISLLSIATVMALTGFAPAHAATVDFQFNPLNTFSGTAPAGSLDALLTDVSGGVQLKLTSSLAGTEFVLPQDGFYFNLNPTKDPTKLVFTLQTNTGFATATTAKLGVDSFKPDGDGLMDIELTWDGGLKPFTSGQSQTYLITGISGLIASDFNFLSNCGQGCGTGAHLVAVHVGNTPNGGQGSAWVGGSIATSKPVPEPASIALLGVGMTAMGLIRRRRNQTT